MKQIKKANVLCVGDASVGIWPQTFELDVCLDTKDPVFMEEVRDQIRELYESMTGETPNVLFDFELEEMNAKEAEMEKQMEDAL